MQSSSYLMSFLAVAVGAGLCGQARAVDVDRDYLSHGTASCQAALPVFDGNIRKRPMALANEGTGNAFVTCDTDTMDNFNSEKFKTVGIYFTNRSAASVTVSCTLVTGLTPFVPIVSFPKTSPTIPSGGNSAVVWTASGDNSDVNFGYPAVSCNLPAGVEINVTRFVYVENVGA